MNAESKSLQNQNSSNRNLRFVSPPVDIKEENDEVTLIAELPGISKEKLNIQVDNNTLIVEAEEENNIPQGYIQRLSERHIRKYRRVFEIDESINQSDISASLNNGVLVLRLKKSEYAKPKRIEIVGG